MKRSAGFFVGLGICLVLASTLVHAQPGPYDPEDWPPTIDDTKVVHYVSTDQLFTAPSELWTSTDMSILTGGDQVTEAITIGGHVGRKETGNFLNVKDLSYSEWADDETIDILVQVYGDEALLGADGNPRNFAFLTGILPDLSFPSGGTIPVECKNRKWNWILFRIPNGLRPDGVSRFVGSIPANAQGDFSGGGVNGGTIRFEGVPGLIVRLVAFGELGAFGEPADMNLCEPPEECPAEPETNLVSVDIDAGTSNHLEVIDAGDQTVLYQDGVGPAGDQRRAVRPAGLYMNFGISDNYLGEPCNDPRAMKICVEFYDDPALTGSIFGPEAYATDDLGGAAFYPADKKQMLIGSGVWVRRSWTVPAVCLAGINTAPLTGGPRLIFDGNAPIFISKVEMAVLRTGTHPLAGQDPLSDCFEDPNICTGAYGNYAEMDLSTGTLNGLEPGSSGGDQEMIQAEAGPVDDRRQAIRPALDDGTPGLAHQYLNFALVGEPLGPSSQPNAHLAICVTYYDDPALIGKSFWPEAYQVDRGGSLTIGFGDQAKARVLGGTDAWMTAYFEIPEIKFQGVNQGPQAAARFVLNGKIFFTRVQYAVIRPCGADAGVNLLEDCNVPVETACADTLDNDGDELADCADEDCASAPACRPETDCADEIDNDGDQMTDCADDDCASAPSCNPETECADGQDNDGDQLTDCFDPDCVLLPVCQGKKFYRADPNNDGACNITDGIYILNFLFLGGPAPTCRESADANNDTAVNITDGIYVLNYLFLGGPAPLPPGPPGKGPPCGIDTDASGSAGDLGCDLYDKCP